MSNGLMPWRLAAFGIVVACGGFFCAGRGGTQRAVLSEMDNLIGGGICQYPQQVHSCTDCVNDWGAIRPIPIKMGENGCSISLR